MEKKFLEFNNYEEFALYNDDLIKVYCKICNRQTYHIYRGFKHHNRRICCLRCEELSVV